MPTVFFVQKGKGQPWNIVSNEDLRKSSKYILGCTPLLIKEGVPTVLPLDKMEPLQPKVINPPSILGHGLQCHPRTAVGIKGEELYLIVVEGKNNGYTLPELQNIGMELKLDSFLNLDGGGSSQFRLRIEDNWISNFVEKEDTNRILGNVTSPSETLLKNKSLGRGC